MINSMVSAVIFITITNTVMGMQLVLDRSVKQDDSKSHYFIELESYSLNGDQEKFSTDDQEHPFTDQGQSSIGDKKKPSRIGKEIFRRYEIDENRYKDLIKNGFESGKSERTVTVQVSQEDNIDTYLRSSRKNIALWCIGAVGTAALSAVSSYMAYKNKEYRLPACLLSGLSGIFSLGSLKQAYNAYQRFQWSQKLRTKFDSNDEDVDALFQKMREEWNRIDTILQNIEKVLPQFDNFIDKFIATECDTAGKSKRTIAFQRNAIDLSDKESGYQSLCADSEALSAALNNFHQNELAHLSAYKRHGIAKIQQEKIMLYLDAIHARLTNVCGFIATFNNVTNRRRFNFLKTEDGTSVLDLWQIIFDNFNKAMNPNSKEARNGFNSFYLYSAMQVFGGEQVRMDFSTRSTDTVFSNQGCNVAAQGRKVPELEDAEANELFQAIDTERDILIKYTDRLKEFLRELGDNNTMQFNDKEIQEHFNNLHKKFTEVNGMINQFFDLKNVVHDDEKQRVSEYLQTMLDEITAFSGDMNFFRQQEETQSNSGITYEGLTRLQVLEALVFRPLTSTIESLSKTLEEGVRMFHREREKRENI